MIISAVGPLSSTQIVAEVVDGGGYVRLANDAADASWAGSLNYIPPYQRPLYDKADASWKPPLASLIGDIGALLHHQVSTLYGVSVMGTIHGLMVQTNPHFEDPYSEQVPLMLTMVTPGDFSKNMMPIDIVINGQSKQEYNLVEDDGVPGGLVNEFQPYNMNTSTVLTPYKKTIALGPEFTIEMWLKRTWEVLTAQSFFGSASSGSWVPNLNMALDVNGRLSVLISFTTYVNLDMPPIPMNQWVHIAVTKFGNTLRFFCNGVLNLERGDVFNDFTEGYLPTPGRGSVSGLFGGRLTDIRLTAGVARYTTNFIPPAIGSMTTSLSNVNAEPITDSSNQPVARDILVIARSGVNLRRTRSNEGGRWSQVVYKMPHSVVFLDDTGEQPDLIVSPVLLNP